MKQKLTQTAIAAILAVILSACGGSGNSNHGGGGGDPDPPNGDPIHRAQVVPNDELPVEEQLAEDDKVPCGKIEAKPVFRFRLNSGEEGVTSSYGKLTVQSGLTGELVDKDFFDDLTEEDAIEVYVISNPRLRIDGQEVNWSVTTAEAFVEDDVIYYTFQFHAPSPLQVDDTGVMVDVVYSLMAPGCGSIKGAFLSTYMVGDLESAPNRPGTYDEVEPVSNLAWSDDRVIWGENAVEGEVTIDDTWNTRQWYNGTDAVTATGPMPYMTEPVTHEFVPPNDTQVIYEYPEEVIARWTTDDES